MTYIILTAVNLFDFEMVINTHIKAGWLPQGGPITTGSIFYQAMTKSKVQPPPPPPDEEYEALT